MLDRYNNISDSTPFFICDFSSPKTNVGLTFKEATRIPCDIFVNYSPGTSVRLDSGIFAASLKKQTNKNVICAISPRDMNQIALQSYLLGLNYLGLNTFVVLKGENLTSKDQENFKIKPVSSMTTSDLIKSTNDFNKGVDFRGKTIEITNQFYIGGTIDPYNEVKKEIELIKKKIDGGAKFFITQPVYEIETIETFFYEFENLIKQLRVDVSLFIGIQIINIKGRNWGRMDDRFKEQFSKHKDPLLIAKKLVQEFLNKGFNKFYVIPPIRIGGERDYETATKLIKSF